MIGNILSFEKTFKIEPFTVPMTIKKTILGHPVLLNKIFAKKPMIIMAAAMKNMSPVSIKVVSSTF